VRRLLVVALVTVAVGGRAHGYVRTLNTNTLVPVYWKETCVPVTIYLNGFVTPPTNAANAGMSLDAIVKSVTAAAHTWSADAVIARATELGVSSCQGGGPFLEIVPTLAPEATKPPLAANDGRNSIIFRTDMWSKSGAPAGMDYDSAGLAVTTVTSEPDGHIVDVDVEINAVTSSGFKWINLDPGVVVPGSGNGDEHMAQLYDLQNALTHEFGHFIGLAHTCFSPASPGENIDGHGLPRPRDDQGNLIPDCPSASEPNVEVPPKVSDSVMFFAANNFLDTSKRVLSDDDVNAVCTIYAPSNFHEACPLDQAAPGCSVAPRSRARARGVGAAFAAALLVVAARRRARRRARVSGPARARS
jgi:hypothetical protein